MVPYRSLTRRLAVVIALIPILLFPLPLQAAPPPVDMVIVLDNSGSVRDGDAAGLRFTAARLAVDQLDVGDQLAVFLYASTVTEFFPLSPMTDGEQRASLRELIVDTTATGYTEVKAGFEAALVALQEAGRPEAQQVVVLITDGVSIPNPVPDFNRNLSYKTQYMEELTAVVGEFTAAEVTVHGVALTEEAEMEFLQDVTAPSGGWVRVAQDGEELETVLWEILAAAKFVPEPEPVVEDPVVEDPVPEPEPVPTGEGLPPVVWVAPVGVVLLVALLLVKRRRKSKVGPVDPDLIKRLDKYIK